MENEPKMDVRMVPGSPFWLPFSRPFPNIEFWMHFGRPLAHFWLPFGTLQGHFLTFGSILASLLHFSRFLVQKAVAGPRLCRAQDKLLGLKTNRNKHFRTRGDPGPREPGPGLGTRTQGTWARARARENAVTICFLTK